MKKKILSIFLVFTMILAVVACSSEGAEKNPNSPVQSDMTTAIAEDGQWMGTGDCYTLDRLNECEYFAMRGNADHIVYCDYEHLADQDGNIIYDGFIHEYEVMDDGIWAAIEYGMVNDEYIQECYFVKLGFDGQELKRLDANVRVDSMAVMDETIYTFDSMNWTLTVFDMDGNKKGSVDCSAAELEDFSASLRIAGDGSLWIFNNIESGFTLYSVDTSAMKLGSTCDLPDNLTALAKGTAEHPFLLGTKDGFNYLDPESQTVTNILIWEECGISGDELSYFIPDGDGFLCLSVTGLARLRPAKPEEIHPRTRLTLGTLSCYEDGSLSSMFNSINNDYFVEVIDYSEDGALSREDALIKLNTEVLSGEGPDMVVISDMNSLQNSGAYMDLYPLIDEDPELSRDDFYGLKALENSEKLVIAPTSLMVSTFCMLKSIGGDRLGWTWDEYFDMESKLPNGGVMSSYLSADFFLQSSLNLYAPHAIDWVNGTCNFDTPDFVSILDAARRGYDPNCPEENPYFLDEVMSMMKDGRMVVEAEMFMDVESYAQNERLNGMEMSYIGWPTPDGSCGSVFYVSGIAVNAGTNYKEGCWEFAKYALKSTYAYKPTFDKAMAEATSPTSTLDGEEKPLLTQSQVDNYERLMENITVAVSDGGEVNKIVMEEAAAMFAGDKSPEETAKTIQSRMSIYVAEHKQN